MTGIVQITSKDNRRLVDLRKLRDGDVADRIFLEGRRLVEEALRSEIEIDELYFADTFRDRGLIDQLVQRSGFIAELPERTFKSIADTANPQGVILTARRPSYGLGDLAKRIAAGSMPLIIMLAEANNPSNLGAIVRTAEAADAAGVIVTQGSADAYSPKSIRAAMGSSLRLPIVTGTEIAAVADWASANGFRLITTEADGASGYSDYDWTSKNILIFGSEGHGVGQEITRHAKTSVSIPMRNGVESLNLGVSAGIILFEARRQNG